VASGFSRTREDDRPMLRPQCGRRAAWSPVYALPDMQRRLPSARAEDQAPTGYRSALMTAADVVTIGCIALGVAVFWLGGWRLRVGEVLLSLRSPWRPLAWALLLVTARHLLVRRPTLVERLLTGGRTLARPAAKAVRSCARQARTAAATVTSFIRDAGRAPVDEAATLGAGLAAGARAVIDCRVAIAAAVALVAGRSLVFACWPQAAFNSDHAVVGLMAKHLAEGRAFPLFFYGQSYMLGVEAWLAAPLFSLVGPSVPALQLPLVLLNMLVGSLLILLLRRESHLSPAAALAASLVFVLAPPATALGLVEANGGSVEPLLYVLLLWVLRGRPALFGLTLAFGFVHREFTLYGLVGWAVLRAVGREVPGRVTVRHIAIAAGWFCLAWGGIEALRGWSSPLGPGTRLADVAAPGTNVGELARRVCWSAGAAPQRAVQVVTVHLPVLFGTAPRSLRTLGITSPTGGQGLPGLSAAALLALALGAARAIAVWRAGSTRASRASTLFPLYLIVVGATSTLAYGLLSCGPMSPDTLRYDLLGLLTVAGAAALFLATEPQRAWRFAACAVFAAWASVSAVSHARLLAEYLTAPPADDGRVAAERLVSDGVQRAWGSYWIAYRSTFLTNERLVVASTGPVRVAEYQRLARDANVLIRDSPCGEDGSRLAGRFYRCRVARPAVPGPTSAATLSR
jgi:hypothetical protein